MALSRPTRLFTVLMPVTRGPIFLPRAIRSVLRQSEADFDLFVVSDGAPQATRDAVNAFAQADDRVRLFDFPKGQRHGEAHRAAALDKAKSRYVAYIDDDGLWLPDHLATLASLLQRTDFANTQHTRYKSGHEFLFVAASLETPAIRSAMARHKINFFGISNTGHRLSAYRALENIWSPGPLDIPSDLFMFAKFLSDADIAATSSRNVTSLYLDRSVGDASGEADALHALWHDRVERSAPAVQAMLQNAFDLKLPAGAENGDELRWIEAIVDASHIDQPRG